MKYFIPLRYDCMSLIRFVNLIRFSCLINGLSMIYTLVNLTLYWALKLYLPAISSNTTRVCGITSNLCQCSVISQ